METKTDGALLARLIDDLNRAVEANDDETICRRVEGALRGVIGAGGDLVPEACHEAPDDHYARRLLHCDPRGRYTVLAMTWGPGQGTPLHDHGDAWGSICVCEGRIRVTPYELAGPPARDIWRFRAGDPIDAGRGATSSVVPPGDHHTIANPFGETAISIHVYKGEMESAGIYLPLETSGTYRREVKHLSYDPA